MKMGLVRSLLLLGQIGWMMGGMQAQRSAPLKPLWPQNPLPTSFLASFEDIYQKQAQAIDTYVPRDRALQRAYYQEQAYYTRQLLLSGKVLCNDSVSHYLDQVADQLLRARPQLRQELQFFAVRSHVVNAVVSGRGIILVNLGLLAHLDSEAELAYILSHEIAHYVAQHALNIFMESRGDETRDLRSEKEKMNLLVQQNQYTREAEFAADEWGTRLFISSGYDLDAIDGAFDLLLRAHLPGAEDSLFWSALFPPDWAWPQRWRSGATQEPVPADAAMSAERYSAPTHPAPEARRAQARSQIKGFPNGGRQAYFQSEARFRRVQRRCRLEVAKLYLADQQFEFALFTLQQLAHRYPQSDELASLIGYGWYALARYANAGRFFDIHQSPFELETGARQLCGLTERLSPQELTEVALSWAWHLRRAPLWREGGLQDRMGRELIQEWQSFYADSVSSRWFATQLSASSSLRAWLAQTGASDSRGQPAGQILPADPRELTYKQRRALVRGRELDLSRVVFVDPGYHRVDERLIDPVRYKASTRRRRRFNQLITTYAGQAELSYQLLSSDQMGPADAHRLRDLALLNGWLEHQVRMGDLRLLNPYHEELMDLCARYGTHHFVWLDCYAFSRNRSGKALVLASGFILPVLLPYSLFYVLTPRFDTVLHVQVYDLSQYRPLLLYPRVVRMRDRWDVVRSTLYDAIQQLR